MPSTATPAPPLRLSAGGWREKLSIGTGASAGLPEPKLAGALRRIARFKAHDSSFRFGSLNHLRGWHGRFDRCHSVHEVNIEGCLECLNANAERECTGIGHQNIDAVECRIGVFDPAPKRV